MRLIRIDRVEIENFKCIKKRELEFPSNINVLYGKNGVGKTSVLDAIFYSFRPEIPTKELIRYGCDEARIVVDFRVGDEPYEIVKVLKRRDSSKTNLTGRGVKVRGSKAVAETVKELGIGRVCTDWWFVTQASIASLVHQLGMLTSKSKIIGFVEALFGLSSLEHFILVYDKYRTNAQITAERDKELIFRTKLDEARAQLQKFQEILSCNEIENQYNKYLGALKAIEGRLQSPECQLVISYNRHKEINEKLNEISQEIEKLRTEQKTLTDQLQQLIHPYRKLFPSSFKFSMILDLCERVKEDLKQSDIAKREIGKVKKKALELFRNRPIYPLNCQDKLNRYHELFHEIHKYQFALEDVVTGEVKKCPVCERELTGGIQDVIREKYKKLVYEFEELRRWNDEFSEIRQKRVELKRQIRELNAIVKRLKLRILDFEVDEKGAEEWFEEIKKIVKRVEEINEEVMKLENSKRYGQAQINVLEEILHVHPEINLDLDVEELIKKREELKTLLKRLEPEYLEYKHAQSNLQNIQNTIIELEEKLEEVKRRQILYETACAFINNFNTVFTECGFLFLKNYLIRLINSHLLRYDCGFILELKENPFGFVVRFLDGSEVALSQLSFGQKVFTSLIFLLTLHQIMPVHQFVLLDEPLLGLDVSNREAFVEIMEGYNGFIIAATATNPFGHKIELC